MADYMRKIVYLSDAQRAELFANGRIVVNGKTVDYNNNDLYLTPEGESIQEPAEEGTNGQVLTTDGQGGRSWTTVTGGASEDMVVVSDTEPENSDTKIWITDGAEHEYQVPTYEEFTTEVSQLNRALNAKYTKPETGIPATDLADGVIPDISGKADEPTGTKAANKVYGLDNNLNPAWVEQSGGGGGSSEPHNYALDGTDLSTVFADADALFAAYSTEDYSKIHVGDYWPVTLNGDHWDYGNFTCPSGVTYYSDDTLTTEAGVTDQSYDAECVADAQLPYGLKPYCTIKISNVTYYVNRTECLDHRVRTLSNAIVNFVVGGINQYWRYGDSGSDNFHNGRPHLLMEARDGIPHTLKMRKQNEAWEGVHVDVFTGDGTTAEFTIDGTVGTIGYVWVAGARKAYNTDYTFGSNKITFKAGKIPASDAKIEVEWMDAKAPWTGSALYKTFNDPDHGILNLIKAADLKLYNHMYKGPNAKGMRYYAETRNKTNQQSGAWEDRGVLFLPMEDEIWGRPIYSAASLNSSTQMQQWPIYGNGGRRQYAKGAGNNASRNSVWCASSTSVTSFANVTSIGNPYHLSAYYAFAAAPCFLLS